MHFFRLLKQKAIQRNILVKTSHISTTEYSQRYPKRGPISTYLSTVPLKGELLYDRRINYIVIVELPLTIITVNVKTLKKVSGDHVVVMD